MAGCRWPVILSAPDWCSSIASQVLTRLVTFTLNLGIARHLSPEAYGVSALCTWLEEENSVVASKDSGVHHHRRLE